MGGRHVCIRTGDERVPGDAGEQAGRVVGGDGPAVVACRQGDPAELVEGEYVRAGDGPDALQRSASGTSKTASTTSAAAIG